MGSAGENDWPQLEHGPPPFISTSRGRHGAEDLSFQQFRLF